MKRIGIPLLVSLLMHGGVLLILLHQRSVPTSQPALSVPTSQPALSKVWLPDHAIEIALIAPSKVMGPPEDLAVTQPRGVVSVKVSHKTIPQKKDNDKPSKSSGLTPRFHLAMRSMGSRLLRGPLENLLLDPPVALSQLQSNSDFGRRKPSGVESKDMELNHRLQRLLGEDRARRNVVDGKVPPAVYDLIRATDQQFIPSWKMAEFDQRKLGTVSSAFKQLLRSMLKFQLPPSGPGDRKPTLLDHYNQALSRAERNADQLSCQYCVTLRFGTAPEPVLQTRSGRSAFDHLASSALENALDRTPYPQNAPKVEACFKFSAKFGRVPPVPAVGCNFDEVLLTARCFYPLMKYIKTKVELFSLSHLGS